RSWRGCARPRPFGCRAIRWAITGNSNWWMSSAPCRAAAAAPCIRRRRRDPVETMSVAREDWLRAHGALWYGDARYRLAWFVLPQAVTCAVAGLCLALAAHGEWGRPAT